MGQVTNTDRRDYQRLLGWFQESEDNVVFLIVDDVSRLHRNMVETIILLELVQYKNVAFIGDSDGIDTRGAKDSPLRLVDGLHEFIPCSY